MTAREETNATWVTAVAECEGLPLALRVRPAADSPTNRAKYPQHSLSVRGGADAEWGLFNDYRRRFPW
jgi:hypothetical protein